MMILEAAGLSYLATVGTMYALQRRLLFRPDRLDATPDAFGLDDFDPLEVTTQDGIVLTAWYRAPATTAAPTVVCFPGNAFHRGCRAEKYRLLADCGFGVLAAAYRGYDGARGRPSEAGLYTDARAQIDRLRRMGTDNGRLVLYGESLGTGVAVQMATENRVAGVVLEAPYTSIPAVAGRRYPWLPTRHLVRDRFDTLSKMHRVLVPVLAVHGMRDRLVAPAMGRAVVAAAAGPAVLRLLPRAGHADLWFHGAGDIIAEFVARCGRVTERPSLIDSAA